MIKAHPDVYLEGRMWSARTMFAVSLRPSESPSWVMRTLDDVYSLARLDYRGGISTTAWGTPIYGPLTATTDFGVAQIVLYLGVGVAGVWQLVRFRRHRDDAWAAACVSTAYIAGWTFVVGVAGELGEQARFRTMTDALVWTVGISGLVRVVGVARTRRHAGSPDERAPSDRSISRVVGVMAAQASNAGR